MSRASVHNISIMEELAAWYRRYQIEVYKANMIIPQIAENLTRSGVNRYPEGLSGVRRCHGDPEDQQMPKTLYCTNPECQAKQLKSFALFVSRDAMNIEGLSEATLEKFIARGFIHDFADIVSSGDAIGRRSVRWKDLVRSPMNNLIASVEKARETTLPRLIYGLGIANIGLANAKLICKEIGHDPERVMDLTAEDLAAIDGIGDVIAGNYVAYFADAEHRELFEKLLKEVKLPEEQEDVGEQTFAGMNFVITGSVEHFANRNEVKALIESKGGKVTGSVTSKTNYLINNNVESTSSKNKKAKDLGIPIITEEDFLRML